MIEGCEQVKYNVIITAQLQVLQLSKIICKIVPIQLLKDHKSVNSSFIENMLELHINLNINVKLLVFSQLFTKKIFSQQFLDTSLLQNQWMNISKNGRMMRHKNINEDLLLIVLSSLWKLNIFCLFFLIIIQSDQ